MKIQFLSVLLLGAAPAWADCTHRGPNVVLVTLDGVRTREFFEGTDPYHDAKLDASERGVIFSKLWERHASKGLVFGKNGGYRIASDVAISLPSYQALMTGHSTHCQNNQCGRVKEETVLEAVRRELKLKKSEVAVFGSWKGMKNSTAHASGKIFRSIFPDFKSYTGDRTLRKLRNASAFDRPEWAGSRKDQYTWDMGLHYLKTYCPRVLYISLVDSDEYGHEGDYPGYVRALRTYDGYLDTLVSTLDDMGAYGKDTTLIMTTDHSRGEGEGWTSHGGKPDTEKEVFLFVKGPGFAAKGVTASQSTHASVRPTIERAMGIRLSGQALPQE
jgi:hypothetical protein